jgi:uncharacterized protein (DUF486 family)
MAKVFMGDLAIDSIWGVVLAFYAYVAAPVAAIIIGTAYTVTVFKLMHALIVMIIWTACAVFNLMHASKERYFGGLPHLGYSRVRLFFHDLSIAAAGIVGNLTTRQMVVGLGMRCLILAWICWPLFVLGSIATSWLCRAQITLVLLASDAFASSGSFAWRQLLCFLTASRRQVQLLAPDALASSGSFAWKHFLCFLTAYWRSLSMGFGTASSMQEYSLGFRAPYLEMLREVISEQGYVGASGLFASLSTPLVALCARGTLVSIGRSLRHRPPLMTGSLTSWLTRWGSLTSWMHPVLRECVYGCADLLVIQSIGACWRKLSRPRQCIACLDKKPASEFEPATSGCRAAHLVDTCR